MELDYLESEFCDLSELYEIDFSRIRTVLEDMLYCEYNDELYYPTNDKDKTVYNVISYFYENGIDYDLMKIALENLCDDRIIIKSRYNC